MSRTLIAPIALIALTLSAGVAYAAAPDYRAKDLAAQLQRTVNRQLTLEPGRLHVTDSRCVYLSHVNNADGSMARYFTCRLVVGKHGVRRYSATVSDGEVYWRRA